MDVNLRKIFLNAWVETTKLDSSGKNTVFYFRVHWLSECLHGFSLKIQASTNFEIDFHSGKWPFYVLFKYH